MQIKIILCRLYVKYLFLRELQLRICFKLQRSRKRRVIFTSTVHLCSRVSDSRWEVNHATAITGAPHSLSAKLHTYGWQEQRPYIITQMSSYQMETSSCNSSLNGSATAVKVLHQHSCVVKSLLYFFHLAASVVVERTQCTATWKGSKSKLGKHMEMLKSHSAIRKHMVCI